MKKFESLKRYITVTTTGILLSTQVVADVKYAFYLKTPTELLKKYYIDDAMWEFNGEWLHNTPYYADFFYKYKEVIEKYSISFVIDRNGEVQLLNTARNLFIIGSCVSRDLLSFTQDELNLVSYHARSSMASLSSSPAPEQYFSHLNNISSSFQRRMVEFDFSKSLLKNIENIQYDVMLIDLIDERFNLGQLGENFLITCSSEFYKAGIEVDQLVLTHSEDYMVLWKTGTDLLFGKLKALGQLHKVRVQKAFWTNQLDTGSTLEKYSSAMIDQENKKLKAMYSYLARYLSEDQFIEIPDQLFQVKSDHQWGHSPFHYIDAYYQHVISRLLKQ